MSPIKQKKDPEGKNSSISGEGACVVGVAVDTSHADEHHRSSTTAARSIGAQTIDFVVLKNNWCSMHLRDEILRLIEHWVELPVKFTEENSDPSRSQQGIA